MRTNTENDLKNNKSFIKGEKNQKPLVVNPALSDSLHVNSIVDSSNFEIDSVRMFNFEESLQSHKRTYLLQFDETITCFVAAEIILTNPNQHKENSINKGLTIWYFEDEEVGRNDFTLEIKNDWERIEFVQSWGTPLPGFWKQGEGRIEILLENTLILKHTFQIGLEEVVNFIDVNSSQKALPNKQTTQQPKNIEQLKRSSLENLSLNDLLSEFDNLVGLKSLKQSLKDFITYLNFVNERKKQGIETEESISANCIFLGNPGTGKTTVARLLGKFFKSIGILEHGHVIEVDRAELVGEYIGETAQKTEKVINLALGGILFIDEAYTLKRDKGGHDFGQEAIDIILKRMEDYKNKFFVIAAGYPEPMQNFIDSNPGLKSRFTHVFTFNNYSPEELTEIFKIFSAKDKYILSSKAEVQLTESLENICSNADETFGNARLIRNLFNETKVELSKRYQLLEENERDFAALNTLEKEDIHSALLNLNARNNIYKTDTKSAEKYLSEVNNLVGLDNVKNVFNKVLASVMVNNLKKEKSIASIHKLLNAIFITEPGSGTSTIARLYAKSLKECRRLSKGQLFEIDGSTFYGLSKIDAYLMIDELFKKLQGNVILVNDAIVSLQVTSDFSDSLLQYFLKKIYLMGEDVVVILAGNKNDIEKLINDFPVLQNQFPYIFDFESYNTRQLLEIAYSISQKNNYQLDEGAWQQLFELINELQKEKRKNFYNARTIKDTLNKAISIQEDRILSVTNIKDDDLMLITYEDLSALRSAEI